MKLFLAAATAAFLPLALGQGNLQGCVADGAFDATRDYFPDKVEATKSIFWDIEYFDTYKVLRNELQGETFVLYQCGTEPPADQMNAGHLHFIPVPLQDGVALSSTTHIPHLELLGLRTEIKAWIGYTSYISSPCMNELLLGDDIVVINDGSADEAGVNALKQSAGPSIVSFHNYRSAYPSTLFNVTISSFAETTNEAIYEWNKFFAVFFNLEKEANELFQESSGRYQCVAEEAVDIVDVIDKGVKPTVIWAAYTNYTGVDGWSVAQCPNYYCEYAEKCSAELINSRDGTIDYFGTTLFTTEAFVELAKDAEHWIYPAGNWEEAYGAYSDVLDTFKSVQEELVFDNLGSGPNAWFENRLAEYDVVLQDFCHVVGTADPLHERAWMRNVFTEEKGTPATTCADVSAPLASRATPCRQVVFLPGVTCFSGENSVELENGSSIQMKDLSIGDLVKTADGTYESIYTFGHYEHNAEANYVQIFAKSLDQPLELSAEHLVFVRGKDVPAPAGSLAVGDSLLLSNGNSAEIVNMKQVIRRGAYAPFTASGSIVVNHVVASNYIAFETGAYVTIGSVQFVSYQWFSHLTQAPRRMYCSMVVGNCENESYTENGISLWTVGPLKAAMWWIQQNIVVKSIVIGLTLGFLLFLAGVEALVNSPWMMAVAVGAMGVLVHKNKTTLCATAKQVSA
mmetsp:Transcript_9231/g.15352  ORF Transcript_9231/g.15352 Transcript_9231/m.15352 type:complete len:683 (-) Transcript_9231:123-2171(-)|eukprot:CAMPEP_0119011628 /NCGR_PEP_ID=MMETSP1176-20130426/5795_1 /TAXON_ID=265551 /ORGANISM="Synedropsis recta cf, Strain CCMP1620" /LENGTH=682 /DNA_ID=CAMNT_0006964483 /DNA_START=61 /DNA_END=2109 /DNA_ORIENTATION=-